MVEPPVAAILCRCLIVMVMDGTVHPWSIMKMVFIFKTPTLSSGASGSDSICMSHGSSYSMDFVSGSWDSEISYTLNDHNGFTLSSGSWPSSGSVYSGTVNCQ